MEALFDLRGPGGTYEFEAANLAWLHPGQSASIMLDGMSAGWAGAMHPAVLADLDIKLPVFAFELDLIPLQIRELSSWVGRLPEDSASRT